jgi:FMN reductase
VAGEGRLLDLGALDADALLGRASHPSVDDALAAVSSADVLVVVTPVYRATYSGLLKVLFDQLAAGALEGTACVLSATGGSFHHYLSLDTGLRSLVASLGGWSVPTVVYATGDDFAEGNQPLPTVVEPLTQALAEARQVVSGGPPPS